jgi:Fic family protein
MKPKYTISNAITETLTQIERARGFLEAATLSDEWVKKMGERALVLEAHHTTHIEGTHLTLEQSEKLLAGEDVPEVDPDDKQELLNYRKAFDFIAEYLADQGPISEGLIREIHKRLVEGVRGGSADPGTYRKTQNYIVNSVTKEVIYTPPPANEVPIMMQEMVEWINNESEAHPVIISGIAQFQLVHIHPFLDGNGRTSRLLSTLCLYRAGYDFKRLFTISGFYDRDRSAFYSALQSVREHDMDLTGWLEYYCNGLSVQLQEIKDKGEKAIRKDILASKHNLSDRQSKALGYVLEHGKIAIQNLMEIYPGVNKRSLQRDLKKLVNLGIFTEKGSSSTDPNKQYVLKQNLI